MFDRIGIKEKSKDQIRDKKGSLALASFLLALIFLGVNILFALLSILFQPLSYLQYFVTPPLTLGVITYYLTLAKTDSNVEFGVNFDGFNNYLKSIGVTLLVAIFTLLWTLLLVIPGIIKAISYSQAMYVLADNPDVGIMESINISKRMTKGYKMDIFIFYLSFIGWALLGMITLGIAYLWIFPYMSTSYANLYLSLKGDALESGACTASDFGFVQDIQM